MAFFTQQNKRVRDYSMFDFNFNDGDWSFKSKNKCTELTESISILRDQESFPSFVECPGQELVPKWYSDSKNNYSDSITKYCYIGEVSESLPFFWSRPGCFSKDIYGNTIMVACYLDNGRHKSYYNELFFKPGTVLLNKQPFRHMFLDGNAGFRIEDDDLKNLVNINITLKELIEYSDTGCFLDYYFEKILRQNLKYSYNNKCWYKNCNNTNKNGKLFRCVKCGLAKYCGKEHQIKDWNKRHKKHCKHVLTKILDVLNDVTIFRNQDKQCNLCGKTQLLKSCGKCHNVMYCSRECQKVDWKQNNHKKNCKQ